MDPRPLPPRSKRSRWTPARDSTVHVADQCTTLLLSHAKAPQYIVLGQKLPPLAASVRSSFP